MAVLLAAVTVMVVIALPMYRNYSAEMSYSKVHGDLKFLYSSVEAYFTQHRKVPDEPKHAVEDWDISYSGDYIYEKSGNYNYQFSTKEEVNGYRLSIDRDGTVEELK